MVGVPASIPYLGVYYIPIPTEFFNRDDVAAPLHSVSGRCSLNVGPWFPLRHLEQIPSEVTVRSWIKLLCAPPNGFCGFVIPWSCPFN